jgi:hypothetical protein
LRLHASVTWEGLAEWRVISHHENRGDVMKILRVGLLASVVGLSGVISAAAQQAATPAPSPEAIEVAKELLAIVSPDMVNDMTSKMTAQIWPILEQGLRTQYPQLDAATSTELRAEFEKLLVADMNEYMSDAPAIYARYLTVAEMRDIQTFYRTPTGAKTLKLMPQIMGEVMANLAPRMQGMMQRVNVALNGVLQKHGYLTR